jgi:hypothetical protein
MPCYTGGQTAVVSITGITATDYRNNPRPHSPIAMSATRRQLCSGAHVRLASRDCETVQIGRSGISPLAICHNGGASDEPSPKPSARLVEQRVRNRLIEALELAASFEDQKVMNRTVNAVNETINLWEDTDPVRWDWGFSEVYTHDEAEAARAFHATWESVANRLPDEQFPNLDEVQARAEWHELRAGALSTLRVFAGRGKLPEDREV